MTLIAFLVGLLLGAGIAVVVATIVLIRHEEQPTPRRALPDHNTPDHMPPH